MRGPRMYGPSKIRYQPGAVQRLFQMRKELPGRRHQRKIKEPFVIDDSRCIKCGACESACAFGAIHIEA